MLDVLTTTPGCYITHWPEWYLAVFHAIYIFFPRLTILSPTVKNYCSINVQSQMHSWAKFCLTQRKINPLNLHCYSDMNVTGLYWNHTYMNYIHIMYIITDHVTVMKYLPSIAKFVNINLPPALIALKNHFWAGNAWFNENQYNSQQSMPTLVAESNWQKCLQAKKCWLSNSNPCKHEIQNKVSLKIPLLKIEFYTSLYLNARQL